MRFFSADYYNQSVYTIDFKRLFLLGKRGILFDIDNTLVPHGEVASEEIEAFIKKLIAIGYKIALISNNSINRVSTFNQKLNLPFKSKAKKPRSESFYELTQTLGLKPKDMVFVGDQIFTDILGANNAGITSVLVKPIDRQEPLQIVMKRKLEKIFLRNRSFK